MTLPIFILCDILKKKIWRNSPEGIRREVPRKNLRKINGNIYNEMFS